MVTSGLDGGPLGVAYLGPVESIMIKQLDHAGVSSSPHNSSDQFIEPDHAGSQLSLKVLTYELVQITRCSKFTLCRYY